MIAPVTTIEEEEEEKKLLNDKEIGKW